MTKYIPLDAVLEEIDKLDEFWHLSKSNVGLAVAESLRSSINALEVKEVGLENIAAVGWDDYVRKIGGEPDTAYMLIKRNEYIEIAKCFFELGLKAQKG